MTAEEAIRIATEKELMLVPMVSIGDWDKTRTVRWLCVKTDDTDGMCGEEWLWQVGKFIEEHPDQVGDTIPEAVEKFLTMENKK